MCLFLLTTISTTTPKLPYGTVSINAIDDRRIHRRGSRSIDCCEERETRAVVVLRQYLFPLLTHICTVVWYSVKSQKDKRPIYCVSIRAVSRNARRPQRRRTIRKGDSQRESQEASEVQQQRQRPSHVSIHNKQR
jgi:hypothetical protein